MRLLLIAFILVMSSCKDSKIESKPKSTNNLAEKKIVSSLGEEITECKETKGDIKLYKEFIKSKKERETNNLSIKKLYSRVNRTHFDYLFESENIDCVISLSNFEYQIFDIYYNSILAENIFNKIIGINKNRGSDESNNYHDFFKRGMIFILNEKANKITVLTFNPFYDNNKPKEISSYFSNTKMKYDKVIMTTGLGYLEVLID